MEERRRRHKKESGERQVKAVKEGTVKAVREAIDALEGDALGSEEA